MELDLVIRDVRLDKHNIFVMVLAAGFAMWNIGVAYLTGLLISYCLKKERVKI